MTDQEHAMQAAIEEINSLRRCNELLAARCHVMDLFELVFITKPNYPSQGASIDAAWQLQRELDKLRGAKS